MVVAKLVQHGTGHLTQTLVTSGIAGVFFGAFMGPVSARTGSGSGWGWQNRPMARTWLSIQIELIHGGGRTLWPRPGRILAAARSHTFAQLATAIDDAFVRWDRAHLHLFDLGESGGLLVDRYWDDPPERARVDQGVRLGTLGAGQQFVYVFDLGDDWAHLCTVAAQRIDPRDTLGITPDRPLPYWGWGSIPDQYGRRWNGDDGDTTPRRDPQLADLPARHPGWGPPRP